MRRDLADIRLADRVFAPHYAQALPRIVLRASPLTESRNAGETLAELAPGDLFEMLELAGDTAWGIAPESGCVGYVAADAIGVVGEDEQA